MNFGGAENGHAYPDLLLACEATIRCGIAAQPESTILGLAKRCHNSPVYLQNVSISSLSCLNSTSRKGAC